MKPYRIIALTCCAFGAMSAPVYANVVTPESSLHGELLDALLTVSLLLIIAVFFLLRRIRSLTWAGVLALPAVFVVGALFDDPFKVTILVLLAYFPARFLVVFFTPGRVVHGGRLQDLLWYSLVFIAVAGPLFYDPLHHWIFMLYVRSGRWSEASLPIGLMRYLPHVVLVLIPLLLLHDAFAGRTKTVWKLVPARLARSRLFRPVFAAKTPRATSAETS